LATPKIPEAHRIALEKLSLLPDAKVEEIVAALQQERLIAGTKELTSSLRPLIPDLPDEDIERISETLFFFYEVLASTDVTAEKLAADVSRAFREFGGVKLPDEKFAVLRKRLVKLFDINSLSVNARASVLRLDFKNIFCGAKILTDARPVFGPNVEDQPSAFVLTHTLKVEYHDDIGRHREFYVTLDEDDVPLLRDVLNRAERKAKSLTAVMERAGVRYLPLDRNKEG
jgi:hypothetical protein